MSASARRELGRWVAEPEKQGLATVVLNSYNQGQYLQQAIESVLGQEGCEAELVLVDNGSTDRSAEIARGYGGDPRVRLFLHGENRPVTRRFNEAVAVARGEFISFLYSDDYLEPGKLSHQVATLRSRPDCGVVYGPATHESAATGRRWERPVIELDGGGLDEMLAPAGARGRPDMSSPLSRRRCFLDFPFDECLFAEGEIIYLHIASRYRFVFSHGPGVILRDHESNAGKAIRRNCEMTRASLRRLRGYPWLDRAQRRAIDRFEAELLTSYGWQGVRLMPDARWARACMRAAVALDRRQLLHPRITSGFALSLLPAAPRRRVNALGHKLRGSPGESVYVEEYAGLEGREEP